MCGIILIASTKTEVSEAALRAALTALTPRGPDAQIAEVLPGGRVGFGFARLHIQGAGATRGTMEQPFRSSAERMVLVNGEIFNSEILVSQLALPVPAGSSDCAVIPALLARGLSLEDTCRQLDGDFAIVVVNPTIGAVEMARDPYGVRPLFYARDPATDTLWVSSEIKGLVAAGVPEGLPIQVVEPGMVVRSSSAATPIPTPTVWHQPPWLKTPWWRASLEGLTAGGQALAHALEEAVNKRLVTRRQIGACLSGGLDSSLVAALAARRLAATSRGPLHTYSVGMPGSPDLEHARLVATHIGSVHHERLLTPEECLAVIPSVIRAIESFDITTVRASVGNYFVGHLVATETPDVKVVLNGDGADEVLGGYLYMRAAPDDAAFEAETDRLLREIHRYDVLRSERSMAVHGLESRSPFLDRQFVAVARGLPTEALRPTGRLMEKSILRTAFAAAMPDLLPEAVLWRRKEAFSDGISRAERSWFEMARAEGERQSAAAAATGRSPVTYTVNPPPTPEALWYRRLFHEFYPESAAAAAAPAMWMPRFVAGATDPSARTLTALYQNTAAVSAPTRR
jgi:asparagine synthase (glutamine-hydrolysing)